MDVGQPPSQHFSEACGLEAGRSDFWKTLYGDAFLLLDDQAGLTCLQTNLFSTTFQRLCFKWDYHGIGSLENWLQASWVSVHSGCGWCFSDWSICPADMKESQAEVRKKHNYRLQEMLHLPMPALVQTIGNLQNESAIAMCRGKEQEIWNL